MRFARTAPETREFCAAVLSAANGGSYWKSIVSISWKWWYPRLWVDRRNIEVCYAEDFVRSTYRFRSSVQIVLVPFVGIQFDVEYGTPKWKRGDMTDFNKGRDYTNEIIARRLAAKEDMKTGSIEQVMPRVDGKPFRCDCGCNVFTKIGSLHYQCNSCEARWKGEAAAKGGGE